MARVYDIIYTTALVISIEGAINDNGFDPVQSPHDGYEVNSISDFARVAVISNNIPCSNPPYTPFAWVYSVSFIKNNFQSLPITIQINNDVRVDYIVGGGNYADLFNQNNFGYNDFLNVLNVNNNQNIQPDNIHAKKIVTSYICESSRCFSSIITLPILYNTFSNNPNFRQDVSTILNIIGKNIAQSITEIFAKLSENNIANSNIPLSIEENIQNLENLSYFPPILLKGAMGAIRGIHNGVGRNNTFIAGSEDFFNNLNIESGYDNANGNNLNQSKLYMLQTELFVLDWSNQQVEITNIWNNISNRFDEEEMDNIRDCIYDFLSQYTGINVSEEITTQLIRSLIQFFNTTFSMGFDNQEIQTRVDLVNNILHAPDQAMDAIDNFQQHLLGEDNVV